MASKIKKGFNLFLLKCLLFGIPVVIGFMILYRLGFAPTVTDSALFDHKMFAIQKQKVKEVKIMGMGSSTPLYALNSEMLVEHYKMSYYNFGTWLIPISDMFAQLKVYVPEYHPEYVIIPSSIGDFRTGGINSAYLGYLNTNRLIRDRLPELFYVKNYSSVYEIMHRKYRNRRVMNLDPWGGILMTVPPAQRDMKAWNEHWEFPTAYTHRQYMALDSLAEYLHAQNVTLIFVEAPIKAAYGATPGTDRILAGHFDTCRSIVERHGAVYLNYYDTTIFVDSLFMDQYHLQENGGRVFTKKLITDLDTIIKR
jgi:hypothetical protein